MRSDLALFVRSDINGAILIFMSSASRDSQPSLRVRRAALVVAVAIVAVPLLVVGALLTGFPDMLRIAVVALVTAVALYWLTTRT